MVPTSDALKIWRTYRMADDLLLVDGIQHSLHGSRHILDRVVDHLVQTHIHALPVRRGLSRQHPDAR